MPLATILNNRITDKKYFVVHGGIADRIDLEFVQVKLDRTKFKQIHRENIKNEHEAYETKLVCDFLWSDPIRSENGKTKTGCFFNSNRNLGSFFGEDVTKDFCERHGFNCIIRSHQVRAKGYSEDHHKCITVFSASHYCDGHNYGAVLKFTPDGHKPKPHRYKTKTGDISDDTFLKTQNLMKRFKILIQKNESEFQKRFEKYDKENTGWIKSTQWAQVLSNFFNEEISVEQLSVLKSFLCECNLDKDLVNYRTMFKQKIGDEKRGKFFDKNTKEVIENLFYLIDRNNDKRISINDAKEALKIVNERLGGTHLFHNAHEFIKLMDKNQDNIIDLDDFKKTFLQDQEVIQSTNEL
ncbi:unnamed protein product [Brachionus calyciflorus]|uniref:EF-hand domain-containing protein n=1 Tax=Brachionus calyciflorus TaxID=104777 RepID=A0A813TY08_9BILA|nr:unnamed protein product [Brachionus calyciflorus]